jgi:hypothetical protein
MRKMLVGMNLLLMLAGVAAAQAGTNMQDGMWEITSTTEMAGMSFSMPGSSFRQCITREDLVPRQQEPQQTCEMLENRIEGDTVIWKIRCTTEGGPVTSEGRITYHGDSLEGVINTTGPQIPGGMKQTMQGKRVGACP